jgi:arylformamidase
MTAMNGAIPTPAQADLDLQYNARATVPDIAPMLRDYAALSAQARSSLPCALNVSYGEHPDETLDIFFCARQCTGARFYLPAWRLLAPTF